MVKKPSRRGGQDVTIHDVARHVGVSPMTVSRVINGEKNVKAETREKVLEAAKTLNYSPNLAARSLATKDSVKIVMLYSNPSSAYLSAFLLGLLDQASKSSIHVFIESCEGAFGIEEAIEKSRSLGADGFILPAPLSDAIQVSQRLVALNLPFVIVASSRLADEVTSVCIDDFEAARSMTQYLLSRGHRKIGFIKGHEDIHASDLRFEGFKAAMNGAGFEVNQDWVIQGHFNYRSGFDAAEVILSQEPRPSAIFASNDDMAAGAIDCAHRLGISVPEQVSVVGFDDTAMALSVWPELSTVRQPIAKMAGLGLTLLQDQIRQKRHTGHFDVIHEVCDFTLIERQSVVDFVS